MNHAPTAPTTPSPLVSSSALRYCATARGDLPTARESSQSVAHLLAWMAMNVRPLCLAKSPALRPITYNIVSRGAPRDSIPDGAAPLGVDRVSGHHQGPAQPRRRLLARSWPQGSLVTATRRGAPSGFRGRVPRPSRVRAQFPCDSTAQIFRPTPEPSGRSTHELARVLHSNVALASARSERYGRGQGHVG